MKKYFLIFKNEKQLIINGEFNSKKYDILNFKTVGIYLHSIIAI